MVDRPSQSYMRPVLAMINHLQDDSQCWKGLPSLNVCLSSLTIIVFYRTEVPDSSRPARPLLSPDKSTLKVYLPNGGFNVVKFGDATDIKVGMLRGQG